MKISLLNLKRQYKYLKDDIEKNISQILEGLAILFNFSLIKYSFTVVSDYTSYVSMISYGNSMFNVANKFNLTLLEQNITYILYMILFLTLAFVVFKKRDIKNI